MSAVTLECTVNNPNGIHCRVATRLADIVAGHSVEITVSGSEEPVDCSSVLDVLALGLVHGSHVCFTAHGPDAHNVLTSIETLFSQTSDPGS